MNEQGGQNLPVLFYNMTNETNFLKVDKQLKNQIKEIEAMKLEETNEFSFEMSLTIKKEAKKLGMNKKAIKEFEGEYIRLLNETIFPVGSTLGGQPLYKEVKE